MLNAPFGINGLIWRKKYIMSEHPSEFLAQQLSPQANDEGKVARQTITFCRRCREYRNNIKQAVLLQAEDLYYMYIICILYLYYMYTVFYDDYSF